MKRLLVSLMASMAAAASYGALAELNVADGSIEVPDGSFVGRDFKIADGFKMELLYLPPQAQMGSWVAVAWDSKGRLLVPSYNSDRLTRVTIPPVGSNDPVKAEVIDSTQVGAAEGILEAFGGIYLNANRSNTMRSGMYKLTDTNGDGKPDKTEVIRNRQGSGDHGTHTLQLTPDGKMITMISGNATHPTEHNRSRVPEIWGEDNLVMRMDLSPPGFHRAPEATLFNLSPDAKDIELFGMGMRNPVSMAYNQDGELFVYDADEEPNMGFNVGYRPTNILHVISGNDAGWRAGSKVHPLYYFDYFGTIGIVGSGSPVGSSFGTKTKFPARYQTAFYAGDWSFGNLYSVFLTPQGSSYKADVEPFISGRPFPVTGVIPNPVDGSMIVLTGGNSSTQVYRVTYVGKESTAPAGSDTVYKSFRDTRHSLEAFHGKQDASAVDKAWPYLSDPDRATRFAARTAIEWQNPAQWSDKALNEADPRKSIAAIAALARVSANDEYHTRPDKPMGGDKALEGKMLASLDRIDWNSLPYQDKLDLTRAYQLVLIRMGRPDDATVQRLIARFDPHLPATQNELDRMLAETLVYLQAPNAATKVMALLNGSPSEPYYGIQEWINPQQRQRQDRGDVSGPNIGVSQAQIAKQDDQIYYAQLLRTLTKGWTADLRKQYMEYFVTAPKDYMGSLTGLQNIRADAIAMIPDNEKGALQSIIDTPMPNGRGRGGLGAAAAGGFGAPAGVGGAAPAAGAAAPAAGPAVAAAGGGGGRGGGARGTPGLALPAEVLYHQDGGVGRAFTDIEVTALTKYDETFTKELKAQRDAVDALVLASLTSPSTVQARANQLGDAELALATARAAGYGKLRADLKMDSASPEKNQALIIGINTHGGRGVTLPGTAAAPARGGAAAPAAGRGQ